MPTISPDTYPTAKPSTPNAERDAVDAALFGVLLDASSQGIEARAGDLLSQAAIGASPSLMAQQERERLTSGTRGEAGIVRGRGEAGGQGPQTPGLAPGEIGNGAGDGGRSEVEGRAALRTAHRETGERASSETSTDPTPARPGELTGSEGGGQQHADSEALAGGEMIGASVAGAVAGGAVSPNVPVVAGAPAATTPAAGGVDAAQNAKALLARLDSAGRQAPAAKPALKPAVPAGAKGGDEAARAQLVRGLASLVRSKGGEVSLELDRGTLGKVRVEVGLREGVVSARFVARTDEARGLLERSVATLRSALEDRGLVVQRLEIVGASDAAAGSNRDSAWSAGAHGGAHDGAAEGGDGRERGLPQGRGERGAPRDEARSAQPSHDTRAERSTDDMGVETLGLDTVA